MFLTSLPCLRRQRNTFAAILGFTTTLFHRQKKRWNKIAANPNFLSYFSLFSLEQLSHRAILFPTDQGQAPTCISFFTGPLNTSFYFTPGTDSSDSTEEAHYARKCSSYTHTPLILADRNLILLTT